ncbi:MAG: Methionyl-tRNA synthetase [Myxococcales bacterium]|nr:Methionyl-tRNA synthetase [Myxococcales bacterium]
MTPFYITTPIYYVNDVPHLGHAYTTIVADMLARFHRMRGDDTRFLTGTDEHGQKVEETANKRGLTPQQLVDQVAPRFEEAWQQLGISPHGFIRTTDDKHKKVVATLWRQIRKQNPEDLYLASYQGWYCVGCEAFYTESQLAKDGDQWVCTVHKKPVNWIDKERSWFFKLSKYAEPLLAHIAKHPEFIRPEQYRSEIVSFLKGGLRDLSVSRTSFQWGIPVPEADPEGLPHVIYVWMDALTNYLSDLCPPDGSIGGPDVAKYWPHAIHLIGKDILRFHAVYWPAFLLSAGLPLPKGIFAHGWWSVRGEKISKSLPATRIDPLKLADALGTGSPLGRQIGIDAMRYYLMREMPLGNDGDFTFESLFGRFNAELANDLGNLINRSLTVISSLGFDAGITPKPSGGIETSGIAEVARKTVADATTAFEQFQLSRGLESIWTLIREGNRFVDASAPWKLAKDPSKRAELETTLYTLLAILHVIDKLIAPVLPSTARTLHGWLTGRADEAITWPAADPLAEPFEVRKPDPHTPLFPRLDDKMQAAIFTQMVPPDVAAGTAEAKPPEAKAAPVKPAEITFDDFAKLELRVGKVLAAVAVPKKDKLLHLQVDLGETKPRSIVAGIAQAYKPELLVGKQVIVVANLAPRKMAGLVSEGMILAAGDEAILGLSAVDSDVPPGTRVR